MIAKILGIFYLRVPSRARGVPLESVVKKSDVTSVPVTVYRVDWPCDHASATFTRWGDLNSAVATELAVVTAAFAV